MKQTGAPLPGAFLLFLATIRLTDCAVVTAIVALILVVYKNFLLALLLNAVDLNRGDIAVLVLQGSDFACALLSVTLFALGILLGDPWRTPGVAFSISKPTLYSSLSALGILLIVGVVNATLPESLAYFRAYLAPYLGLVLGVILFRHGQRAAVNTLKIGGGIFAIYLLFEIALRERFLSLLNIARYSELKWGESYDNEGFVQLLGTFVGDMVVPRIIGPQLHPISVGYLTLFFMIVIAQHARSAVAIGAGIISALLVCTFASKGALAVALMLVGLMLLRIRLSTWRVLVAAVLYAIALLWFSSWPLTSAYDHYLGLLGGLGTALANPLGHGIGVGGNLTSLNTPAFGSESFVGVAVVHLGIFALVYFFDIYRRITCAPVLSAMPFLSVGLVLVLATSVLQEEAWSITTTLLPFTYLGFRSARLAS